MILVGEHFDVSLVKIDEDKTYEVIGTSGNDHLGGEDFNNFMLDYLIEKFNSQYSCDMRQNQKAVERLRSECEGAKLLLSQSTRTIIEIDALFENHDFKVTVNRADFKNVCSTLFNKSLDCVYSTAGGKPEKGSHRGDNISRRLHQDPKDPKDAQVLFWKRLNVLNTS